MFVCCGIYSSIQYTITDNNTHLLGFCVDFFRDNFTSFSCFFNFTFVLLSKNPLTFASVYLPYEFPARNMQPYEAFIVSALKRCGSRVRRIAYCWVICLLFHRKTLKGLSTAHLLAITRVFPIHIFGQKVCFRRADDTRVCDFRVSSCYSIFRTTIQASLVLLRREPQTHITTKVCQV